MKVVDTEDGKIIQPFDFEAFRAFIATQSPATKIYIGGDSERIRKNGREYADFMIVVVVHVDGCRGCRIFSKITRERNYDQKLDKPALRLMSEVYKISEMYNEIKQDVAGFDTQVHLDLNAHKVHASNVVVAQALGYIKGTCDIDPQIKPNAWAASYAADRAKEVEGMKRSPPTAEKLARQYKQGRIRN